MAGTLGKPAAKGDGKQSVKERIFPLSKRSAAAGRELMRCVQGARLPADRLASGFVELKILSHFSEPALRRSGLPSLILGAVTSSSLCVFEVLCISEMWDANCGRQGEVFCVL